MREARAIAEVCVRPRVVRALANVVLPQSGTCSAMSFVVWDFDSVE